MWLQGCSGIVNILQGCDKVVTSLSQPCERIDNVAARLQRIVIILQGCDKVVTRLQGLHNLVTTLSFLYGLYY